MKRNFRINGGVDGDGGRTWRNREMAAQKKATEAATEAEKQVRAGLRDDMSTEEQYDLLEAAFQAGQRAARQSRLGAWFRANMTDAEYEAALVELY